MIKAPSIQHEYTLVWSGDPALSLPEDPTERARVLDDVRLRGDWPSITVEGQQPTLFHFKDLTRAEFGWWDGERSNSARLGRPLGALEASDLVLRLALRSVDNFGTHKVTRKQHGQVWLCDVDIINAINDQAGAAPLIEFAEIILERAANPIRPL